MKSLNSQSMPSITISPNKQNQKPAFPLTSYNFHRNNKSLKILNIHLKEYKSYQSASDVEVKQNYGSMLNSNGYGGMSLSKFREDMSGSENTMKDSKDVGEKGVGDKDKEFVAKCEALVDSLLLNLGIFKKVYASCKKKRSVISKLYGWDPIFNPIFFQQYGETFSQELKPKITKQSIISELGLQKKSFTNQNIYNKLRFFLSELINANLDYQKAESMQQKQKLIESSIKLRGSLQKISNQPGGKKNALKYVEIMRQTHYDMAKMKMRIKNKAQQIQKLASNTGSVRVNPFYLKEEQNVNDIQSFVKNAIKKM